MQRIIENFPEFKKGERNTSKHFNVLEELRKLVDSRNLYDVSEVEQDIVSGSEDKKEHFKSVMTLIEKEDINKLEALRLVLLFALRYENDDKIRQLKNILKSQHEMQDEQLGYIDCLLEYAGKAQRKGGLFKEGSSMMNYTKKFFNSMFGEDVKNVLLQHTSWLTGTILEQFSKGKLDQMQYPYFSGGHREAYGDRASGSSPCKTLIVFMIGGVTYEEAKEVALFGAQSSGAQGTAQGQRQHIAGSALGNLGGSQGQVSNPDILLGGTFIHNSKTFLADISQIRELRHSGMQKLEIE